MNSRPKEATTAGGNREVGQGVGRFLSGSAPESTVDESENGTPSERGYVVMVVDLVCTLLQTTTELTVTQNKQTSGLAFSGYGYAVVSVMCDEHTAQVFQAIANSRTDAGPSHRATPRSYYIHYHRWRRRLVGALTPLLNHGRNGLAQGNSGALRSGCVVTTGIIGS